MQLTDVPVDIFQLYFGIHVSCVFHFTFYELNQSLTLSQRTSCNQMVLLKKMILLIIE